MPMGYLQCENGAQLVYMKLLTTGIWGEEGGRLKKARKEGLPSLVSSNHQSTPTTKPPNVGFRNFASNDITELVTWYLTLFQIPHFTKKQTEKRVAYLVSNTNPWTD